ncbi:recombinase family protein [Lacrimispora sp.]|uniref:recombinase family protein n=1 Tax=Lacrimispora sp. TaxID=2719234 RepID=UPI0028AD7482|nr:recombinase family protein [Lacrimispora sp.]
MIYGYARCSTNETKQDINRQKRELINKGVPENNIYFEYESGTKIDREQLNRLLGVVKQGDTIIATELSRITRSTKQLCDLIEQVKDKHLKVVIGSFEVDCSKDKLDAMTLGMLQMMGVFAELERNMISERVKSGMVNAKARGSVIGRPVLTSDNIPNIFMKYYPKYKQGEINISELSRLCDMSRTTIYKYLNILGDK